MGYLTTLEQLRLLAISIICPCSFPSIKQQYVIEITLQVVVSELNDELMS